MDINPSSATQSLNIEDTVLKIAVIRMEFGFVDSIGLNFRFLGETQIEFVEPHQLL